MSEEDYVTTSFKLPRGHHNWMKENGINMSSFFREAIEAEMLRRIKIEDKVEPPREITLEEKIANAQHNVEHWEQRLKTVQGWANERPGDPNYQRNVELSKKELEQAKKELEALTVGRSRR
jgi:hypothetical protein